MDKIIIRKATEKDLDILFRFEQEIINAERSFDSTLKKEPTNYYDLKELLDSPKVEIVVATVGKEVIGSGYARIKSADPFLEHQYYAYLGFIYVVPDHRGKGVSKKIIEALKQWSASQNITEVRLEVYYTNINAVKAYEKAGFERHMIEMRMSVPKS